MLRFSSLPLVAALAIALSVSEIAWGQPGTTVQLPTFGVAIDADGVLEHKTVSDPTGRLHAARIEAAKTSLPGDLAKTAELRKISLRRLEAALREKRSAGDEPDEAMRHLAGLTSVKYAFFSPATRDIVIAGPAEGYAVDPAGRTVGIESGRPTILLDDLLVALRAFPRGGAAEPFLGCTIDPSADGLAKLQAFQKKIPRAIPQHQRGRAAHQIAHGMREALGMANVRVFGVPADSHFAQVLVEADYRMKLIGIGLEPPPVQMATFLGSLNSASHATLQRWWFTPNYDCVRLSEDRLAMELVGQGVQLQSEDKVIGPGGKLLNPAATGRTNPASTLFTTAFTKKYAEIAAASPVYAQLRNMIDLAVLGAFLRTSGWYDRLDGELDLLLDAKSLPVASLPTPRKAPCAVNSLWKGSRLFTPAGGGVSLVPTRALAPESLLTDETGKLTAEHGKKAAAVPTDRWWWD
jgi:hypothetical protein